MGLRQETGVGVVSAADILTCLRRGGRTSTVVKAGAFRAAASRLAALTGCRRPSRGLPSRIGLPLPPTGWVGVPSSGPTEQTRKVWEYQDVIERPTPQFSDHALNFRKLE